MAREKQRCSKKISIRKPNPPKPPKSRPPRPNPTSPASIVKRSYRHRPGTVAVRDIARFQRSVEPILSRKYIRRLARQCILEHNTTTGGRISRIERLAIDALREATEFYMFDVFS